MQTLPEGAQITRLVLTDIGSPEKPLLSLQRTEGQTWDEALAAESASRREAIRTLLAQLRTLRAKSYVSETFSDTVLVDGSPRPWQYRLESTLALGGAAGQTSVNTLYLAPRTGGGTQFAAIREPAPGLVFELDQALLDALWAVTYADRDPGPPAAPAAP